MVYARYRPSADATALPISVIVASRVIWSAPDVLVAPPDPKPPPNHAQPTAAMLTTARVAAIGTRRSQRDRGGVRSNGSDPETFDPEPVDTESVSYSSTISASSSERSLMDCNR